jgi:hypothetical protein
MRNMVFANVRQRQENIPHEPRHHRFRYLHHLGAASWTTTTAIVTVVTFLLSLRGHQGRPNILANDSQNVRQAPIHKFHTDP